MDLELKGNRALVLGASRGLSKAITQGLAAEGAEVFAAARNLDAIRDWAAGSGNVHTVKLDVSDVAAMDALADRLLADDGVDILINNAGGQPPGAALGAKREDWTGHFQTMAANLFHLTGRLMPAMQGRGWGRVISITSSGVEQPIPNLALSNGIRAAVVGWPKTQATEMAGDGVTANVVLPSRIHSQRVDDQDAAAAKRTGNPVEQIATASAAAILAGRHGRPEEFADVVVFLASARDSYVTSSRVRIDGRAIRSK